jgi:hypothetical protein
MRSSSNVFWQLGAVFNIRTLSSWTGSFYRIHWLRIGWSHNGIWLHHKSVSLATLMSLHQIKARPSFPIAASVITWVSTRTVVDRQYRLAPGLLRMVDTWLHSSWFSMIFRYIPIQHQILTPKNNHPEQDSFKSGSTLIFSSIPRVHRLIILESPWLRDTEPEMWRMITRISSLVLRLPQRLSTNRRLLRGNK